MKSDAEKFQPLGPAIRKDQPKPPPVVKKETSLPQPPLHINDMEMIKKDFGNIPPPWGIFNRGSSWSVEYFQVARFKVDYFRGYDES